MKTQDKHVVLVDGFDFGDHDNIYVANEQAYRLRLAGWKHVIVKPLKIKKP